MPPLGLVTMPSPHGPEETLNRLEAELASRGLTVFAWIDHAARAEAIGLALQPTELLIFGGARSRTPLMQAARTIGVDLPLPTLVWQDAERDTWLTSTIRVGWHSVTGSAARRPARSSPRAGRSGTSSPQQWQARRCRTWDSGRPTDRQSAVC